MKNRYMILLFLLLAGVFLYTVWINPSLRANEIHVALDGDDVQDGSRKNPVRTLKQAAALAKPGTTVYVHAGVYTEPLVVKNSGTKAKPVVFRPYRNDEVILSGKKLKSQDGTTALITMDGKAYVTIRGFIIEDIKTKRADETIIGIYLTGPSHDVTLEQNTVRRIETSSKDGNGHGIAVYGTEPMHDITLTKNRVEDCRLGSSESIVLNGDIRRFTVKENRVSRNDNIGIDLIGHEGVATSGTDYVRDGIVIGNIVHDISSYGNPAYGNAYAAGGIYVDGGKNIDIINNTVYRSDIGIEVTSEHHGKYAEQINVVGNTVYENNYTGIAIGGYDSKRGGTRQTVIQQNVLYRNDTKGEDGGQLLVQHYVETTRFEENTVTAGPSRIMIANYVSSGSTNQFARNVYEKEPGKTSDWIWEEDALSFAAFNKQVSDATSLYTDPLYVNAEDYDFRLKENSPVLKLRK